MEFVRQRSNFILGWEAAAADVPALGSWMILANLTSPATRTVLPSNDALYGACHVELDLLGAVVISVPANIDDRYFSVSVMDAHFNNVFHIGPRWTGNEDADFLVVPPGWSETPPEGMTAINAPTASVCLFNRMLVRYEDGDLERVRHWQAGLRITQLSHWSEPDPVVEAVDVSSLVHPDLNAMTDGFEYLSIGLDHLERNPLVRDAAWLSTMVHGAGFAAAADDPELRRAVNDGIDDATNLLDATLTTWPREHGWMTPDPYLGLPNPNVLASAAFQQFQIGSNDIAEAAYSFVDTDADGELLDGGNGTVYEVLFGPGAAPPVHAGGYWSLTMYDDRSLLVENPIDRYATRPERPGFVVEDDGSIVITCRGRAPARRSRSELASGTSCPVPARPARLLPDRRRARREVDAARRPEPDMNSLPVTLVSMAIGFAASPVSLDS